MKVLDENEIKRYSRQITIPNIGLIGQKKLNGAKVLVVGAGGLGSAALFYLVSAGIGTIGIIDNDVVDYTNLNRQIIHFEEDIGKTKTESAQYKLHLLNKNTNIITYNKKLLESNAKDIIKNFDYVIDASDNFETKFLINDICVSLRKPFTIAGISRFEGQILTVIPGKTACYRCIYKDRPRDGTYPTPAETGVMGTTAGYFGILEANECIKYFIFSGNKGKLLTDQILYCDLENNSFDKIVVQRDKNCKTCSSLFDK